MKTLGIIPARGGSKGVPGKNKKPLCGKPLVLYTIEAARKSKLDAIAISTDDDEILEIGKNCGIITIKRPSDLSLDTTPTLPVIQHSVESIPVEFDAFMILQPTSPFRSVDNINECIDLFKCTPEADSLVSVVKAPHKFTPNSLMKMNNGWLEHYENEQKFLRRQEKPEYWGRNGAAVYLTRMKHLFSFILGGKILPYEMSKLFSIDIDDFEDWLMAEIFMENVHRLKQN